MNDIDVVPPADADHAVAASLQQAVVPAASSAPIALSIPSEPLTSNQVTAPDDALPDLPDIDINICYACESADDSPPRKCIAYKMFNWVSCKNCPRWYHNECVGHKGKVNGSD